MVLLEPQTSFIHHISLIHQLQVYQGGAMTSTYFLLIGTCEKSQFLFRVLNEVHRDIFFDKQDIVSLSGQSFLQ